MPQAVQSRPKVQITEEQTCKLTFVIPVFPGFTKLRIFKGDDIGLMIALDDPDQVVLFDLAIGIMDCEMVDHISISRFRRQAKFEVQLITKMSNGTYGRIDALIRAIGCDPIPAP